MPLNTMNNGYHAINYTTHRDITHGILYKHDEYTELLQYNREDGFHVTIIPSYELQYMEYSSEHITKKVSRTSRMIQSGARCTDEALNFMEHCKLEVS